MEQGSNLLLAQAVYSEVFSTLDDKRLRERKTAEIEDWLDDGYLGDNPSAATLAAEWREYDYDDLLELGLLPT